MRHAGQEGALTGGQESCRSEGNQDSRDAGQEGDRTVKMQVRRKGRQDGCSHAGQEKGRTDSREAGRWERSGGRVDWRDACQEGGRTLRTARKQVGRTTRTRDFQIL